MSEKEVAIWAGAILVGVLILGSLLPEPPPDDIAAGVDCEAFVRKRLVSPSSADFQFVPDVTDRGGGRWTVGTTVEAQNVFGAHLRRRFTCELHYVGQTAVFDRVTED